MPGLRWGDVGDDGTMLRSGLVCGWGGDGGGLVGEDPHSWSQ